MRNNARPLHTHMVFMTWDGGKRPVPLPQMSDSSNYCVNSGAADAVPFNSGLKFLIAIDSTSDNSSLL